MVMSVCKNGEIYGIETGDFVGRMFVVADVQKDYIGCLVLPEMKNVHVPHEAFERGRNTHIMVLIEKLPRSVFKTSKAQYIKNENTNNRWQQSDSSNVLGCKESIEANP